MRMNQLYLKATTQTTLTITVLKKEGSHERGYTEGFQLYKAES